MALFQKLWPILLCLQIQIDDALGNPKPEFLEQLGDRTTFYMRTIGKRLNEKSSVLIYPEEFERIQAEIQYNPVVILIGPEHEDGKLPDKLSLNKIGHHLKFGTSVALIIPPDGDDAKTTFYWIGKMLENFSDTFGDPSHTFLFLGNVVDSWNTEDNDLNFFEVETISRTMVVAKNYTLYIPCLACRKEKLLHEVEKGKSFVEIDKLWDEIQSDFHETNIDFLDPEEDFYMMSEEEMDLFCSGLTEASQIASAYGMNSFDICRSDAFKRKHNMERINNNWVKFTKKPLAEVKEVDDARKIEKSKSEVFLQGNSNENIVFDIVSTPPAVKIDLISLLYPFDFQTWVASIVAFLLIASLMFFQMRRIVIPLPEIGLIMLALILDQDAGSLAVRLRRKAAFLLILWFTLTTFLKTFYQGELYSYLSTSSNPMFPKNLEELAESRLQIMLPVYDSDDWKYFDKKVFPEILRYGEKYKNREWVNKTLDMLINNNLKFLGAFYGENDLVNSTYAILARESLIKGFGRLNTAMINNTYVYDVKGKIPYSDPKYVTMKKSFVYRVTSKTMASLVESGIYDMWKVGSNSNFLAGKHKEMAKDFKDWDYNFNDIPNYNFLFHNERDRKMADKFPEPEPASLKTLAVPFIMYIFMMGVATLVFLFERYWHTLNRIEPQIEMNALN